MRRSWKIAWILLLPIPVFGQDLDNSVNESVVMIAKPGVLFPVQLETTLYRPEGDGPFPIAVINHGKSPGDPHFQARYRPQVAARYFLQRGYLVVVPMRQGFSKSSGRYVGVGCNVESNGRVHADDVQTALDYVTTLPYADKSRIVVMGQSHGGWTTLAFGARNYPGVRGLVNFAGGLRQEECAGWESTLARSAGSYAVETKVPSLWFYGDNDSFFWPTTYRSMFETYRSKGGQATLVAFGKFGGDAHRMFGSVAGESIWEPEMSKFLQQIGLPHDPVFPRYARATPMPTPTDFAPFDKAEAVPYLNEKGRSGYANFLTKGFPRAFALASNGSWGWANGDGDPLERAVQNCNKNGKGACRLYAVDEIVVWKP